MLDLVVNDALEGVDIIARYRRFYAMLMADSDLHHDFIIALELLEEEPPRKSGASTLESSGVTQPPDPSA